MQYSNFKTLTNLIDYHSTSEPTMYLCDLTGLSVDDHAFEQLQTWFDENDPFLSASKTMRESGGSFASAIGDAYQCADRKNSLILEQAFADLFRRFMTSITDEV
jgi:hypothetical protein